MQANRRTLDEILSVHIRLIAPLFQRPYVWDRQNNWEQLWGALSEVFQRRLDGGMPRPYFLGALVLDQVPNPVGTVQAREIIDGQQRMTTLQIIMEQARRICLEHGETYHADLLKALTRNHLERESDEQYKVWPTNVDRKRFRNVMTGTGPGGRLEEAAQFFRECLMEWLNPMTDGLNDRARAMVTALRQDLVFVAIDLGDDDDGQLIFETLNSLGTPLLPSDLVKNLLFRAAMAEGMETDRLYREYWEGFEKDEHYWRAKVKVGRRERVRLDLFLQHYMNFRMSKEVSVAHLFRDYRDAYGSGYLGNVEEALADFRRCAVLFREFDEAPHSTAAGSLRYLLEILDLTVMDPLTLGISVNVSDQGQRDEMFKIVESYLARRTLCVYTSKNLNRISADLISTLNRTEWTPEGLRAQLLQLEGNSSIWPTDAEIQWRCRERDTYYSVRTSFIAHLLARIEDDLRSGKSELPFNVYGKLEVEHVMPQSWQEHWPLPEGALRHDIERRDDRVNRLGNLTILTGKLNKDVSNGPWTEKRCKLNQFSVLLLNSDLASRQVWDEQAIEARTQSLAEKACALWPR